jgi:hypothetical protein
VANSSKRGRARSRKRRRAGAPRPGAAASGDPSTALDVARGGDGATRRRQRSQPGAAERRARGFKDPQSLGERPRAPWHPFPLSELLILVGAVATIVAFGKLKHGLASGGATLVVGVVAVLVGTVEFTMREHRSGYRSHTILLSTIPAVVVYTGTLLVLSAFVSPLPAALKVAPLVLAVPVFALLFRLLRARFADARRERVFAGDR